MTVLMCLYFWEFSLVKVKTDWFNTNRPNPKRKLSWEWSDGITLLAADATADGGRSMGGRDVVAPAVGAAAAARRVGAGAGRVRRLRAVRARLALRQLRQPGARRLVAAAAAAAAALLPAARARSAAPLALAHALHDDASTIP